MSIGYKRAFPLAANSSSPEYAEGMTYREWLIGQIAIGQADIYADDRFDKKDIVNNLIEFADHIINTLDEEICGRRINQIKI